jgi:hypothetical protein
MRSAIAMSRWIGVAVVTALLAAAPADAKVLVCGVVRSGGAAVKGANLVVLERGATAVTDSSGSFCLDLDEAGVVTVRVIAIGFEPGERVVSATGDGATVRFELSTLRGGSPGLQVQGESAASAKEKLVPVAPSTASSSDPKAAQGEQLLASFPVLLTAADSSWLTAKHKGSQWDTLFVLHDALRGRGHFGDAVDPRTWQKVGDRLDDLKNFWCVTDAPRKKSLGDAPCAYVERGIALTEARAATLSRKGLTRNTKVYLQGLAGSKDSVVADWARRLLDRVAAGSGMGLAPPAPER